jgi:two-component SAPR family response regulator
MNKIKVIVIDDERSSREELKRAIKKYQDLEMTGEAKNADEAKTLIETQRPDLIFLDIQMPERSGFDLLESLEEVPEVIFTTAFDQYAVQAFEISALDYLMKPIREERFTRATRRGSIGSYLLRTESDVILFGCTRSTWLSPWKIIQSYILKIKKPALNVRSTNGKRYWTLHTFSGSAARRS